MVAPLHQTGKIASKLVNSGLNEHFKGDLIIFKEDNHMAKVRTYRQKKRQCTLFCICAKMDLCTLYYFLLSIIYIHMLRCFYRFRNIRNFICNALYTLQFSKTKTRVNTGIIYCQVVSLKILVLLANWSMRLLVFHNISSLSWRKMALHLDLGFIALSNIIYITYIPNDLLSYILARKYLNPPKNVLKYTQKKLSK